ncbi:MAG: Trm112 family protein [Pseudomonadota bacterium]
MDSRLLELLVCPASRAPLVLSADRGELWCRESQLAYPIQDGVPVLLTDAARPLTERELAARD